MSKSPEVYLVTFHGHYIGSNGQNVELHPYEITVAMEEDMVDGKKTSAQSVFKGSLAEELMPLKYPGYTSLSTYHIKEAITVSGAPVTFIQLKNKVELRELIANENLPVQAELYPDTDALREAIILCKREPDAFKAQQDNVREVRGAKIITKSRALQLNEETAKILRENNDVNAESMSHVLSLDVESDDPVPDKAELAAAAKAKAAAAIKAKAKEDPAKGI